MVIWITGLSGAGKTTLGTEVYRQWKERAPNTVLVDGDTIRALFKLDGNPDLYRLDGRRMVAGRIHELCKWLDGQNFNVVCCTISLFGDLHDINKQAFSRYFEVFLDVPMDVLRRRDNKNIYARAFDGKLPDVVGVDLPFDPPSDPDFRIDNTADRSDFAEVASDVLAAAGVS